MRGEDLLRDIEYINDDLIEEAMEDKNSTESNNTNYSIAKALSGGEKKRFIWRKWGSIAACATVLGISAAAIWVHSNKKLEEIPIKNRAGEYADKWDKNVFLNNFDEEDENPGTEIKLKDIYIEECLPQYKWKHGLPRKTS